MKDVFEPAKADWPDTDAAWLERVAAIAPAIDAAVPEAERARRLPPALMDALHAAGMFRLVVPRRYGGAEVALPTFVRVTEALAMHDASTSWCVCQAAGCALVAAFLDAPVAEAIWGRDPRGVLAWGAGPAEAVPADGGYRVTAKIAFVSGGHYASWLGAHCRVVEPDGRPRVRRDGRPEVRTVLFPASTAALSDDWDALGMRGTGSDGFAVEDLFVAEDHTVLRDDLDTLRHRAPLYLFSGYAVYGVGFAGTALGIARAFLLGECDRIWDEVAAADDLPVPPRMRLRLAATHAIQEAVAVVDVLFNTAGTSAIFPSSPFERRFRDIHTVAQQIQGRKTHFQVVGAWMLGHPPDMNVI